MFITKGWGSSALTIVLRAVIYNKTTKDSFCPKARTDEVETDPLGSIYNKRSTFFHIVDISSSSSNHSSQRRHIQQKIVSICSYVDIAGASSCPKAIHLICSFYIVKHDISLLVDLPLWACSFSLFQRGIVIIATTIRVLLIIVEVFKIPFLCIVILSPCS